MPWGWVNYGVIFIFGWTIPLKQRSAVSWVASSERVTFWKIFINQIKLRNIVWHWVIASQHKWSSVICYETQWFICTPTHAHSGQLGPEDGAKEKNERANCLSSYIYENVANMHSGNSFSSGLFKMPCEQVSILLYLLSVMDYDMPGYWLGYFDRSSNRSLGQRNGFGSTMEMNGFSVRIPARCSPGWYKDVLKGLPSRQGPPTDHPLQTSSSSSLFVVRGETLKLSSMSTRWFQFHLFAGITLSSLQTESQS